MTQETIKTRVGDLKFTHDFANGYPTKETVEKLFDEIDFQRACQAYLWGLPIVPFAQWQHVHENDFGAKSGDVVLYHDYTSKTGILTANATTPYVSSFINLEETGPIVIDIPEAEVRGAMHSMWQIAIAEMVKPGRYVFHAPGTEAPKVKNAQIFETSTNSIFFAIRLLSTDQAQRDKDLAAVKIYPFSKIDSPPKTKVIDVAGRSWQGWHPRGIAYFETLADILGREPVAERDRFFMAMLKPLGIEKGKPFAPDKRQKRILEEAALVGEAMAKANDFVKLPRMPQAEYVEGSNWEIATVSPPDQRRETYDELDGRAAWFYEAVTNDPAMMSTTPGKDQIYLGGDRDADGAWLDGAHNYVLRVPANAPVAAFWSLTVYDVATRALIVNKQQIADRSSRMALDKNKDGSVDIYVGPDKPKSGTANWIPTVPGKAWFAYFRFYSPTKPYFDRSWVLPDVEKLK